MRNGAFQSTYFQTMWRIEEGVKYFHKETKRQIQNVGHFTNVTKYQCCERKTKRVEHRGREVIYIKTDDKDIITRNNT